MARYIQNLAANMKARRKELGITQEELADLTGISYSQIRSMEKGTANPNLTSLERITEVLRISIADLTEDSEDNKYYMRLKEDIKTELESVPLKKLKIIYHLLYLTQK